VSAEEIEQLVLDRSLARETFGDEVIAYIWGKAAGSYADAARSELSTDGRFQLLYTAALQAAFATLAAHGLRVKSTANHYKTFYALRKLAPSLDAHGLAFEEMRATRNDSVYGAFHNEAELAAHLSEAVAFMPASLAALRCAILTARPGISPRLPHIE
jgi:hypothetical protein